MKKTIAVLFGGRGQEHAVSCASAAAILAWLDRERYDPLPVAITREGDFFLYTGATRRIGDGTFPEDKKHLVPTFPARLGGVRGFLDGRRVRSVDAVIPCLHGDYGEDGRVQGLLDCAGLPYVGAGCAAGAVAADKAMTKAVAKLLGIPTLPWLLFTGREEEAEVSERVRAFFGTGEEFPALFVKPDCLGSSVGASPAGGEEEFLAAYRAAARYGRVIVEPRLAHPRELEVAALLTEEVPILSYPGEVDSGTAFYSYEEKYLEDTAKITLSPSLDRETEEKLYAHSASLLSYLGCEGLARVDYFLTEDGTLCFNEVNTFPGFTAISLYPRLMERAGIPPAKLLTKLVEAAIDRRL
ncbi:MAG TPA: D-alanine--D-alanine ligase A [Clostridiales bacterium]|nr:D-alanine--D-alanine ligase A [Clostridiales bacterium]